jgi:hypothetical protein
MATADASVRGQRAAILGSQVQELTGSWSAVLAGNSVWNS